MIWFQMLLYKVLDQNVLCHRNKEEFDDRIFNFPPLIFHRHQDNLRHHHKMLSSLCRLESFSRKNYCQHIPRKVSNSLRHKAAHPLCRWILIFFCSSLLTKQTFLSFWFIRNIKHNFTFWNLKFAVGRPKECVCVLPDK